MAKRSRYQGAKRHIKAYFNSHKTRVFSRKDIEEILFIKMNEWKLPQSFYTNKFIQLLVEDNILAEFQVVLDSDTYVNWCIPDTPMLVRVSNVRKKQYFSHYSAVVAHGLTQQLPKSYYINQQLTPKKQPRGTITQTAIDKALAQPFRDTSMVGYYMGNSAYGRFHYLASKASNDTGIIKMPLLGVEVNVTNLERTLLDITVSPENAGGVFQVLEAYKEAANNLSINKLLAYLKKLDYIYPHHQRIGFYMEKSGAYSTTQIDRLRKIDKQFDFYLTHNLKELDYSKDWRMYYPQGL